jgi:hypothetical protein
MPQFYSEERAEVYAPQAAALGIVVRTLTRMGGKPTVQGGRVTCKLGRWLTTRLVGGVPAKWLPVEANVYVIDQGDYREIVVQVAERFGVGIGRMMGREGELRWQCQQTARSIRDTVRRQAHRRRRIPAPAQGAPPSR